MEEKVFDRVEKKYLITRTTKRSLLSKIKKNLTKDKYHKSGVYNIYFDNDNFDLIAQSIDWENFKHKIRARSYEGYDRVFLEVKTKIRGEEENIGYKRRFMMTHEDFVKFINHEKTAEELANQSIEKATDQQIAREIDYLVTYFNLKPKILVIYNRESYKDNDGIRITFDERLKYRDKNLTLNPSKDDTMYFKDKRNVIMEIKANGALPLWLTKAMSELKIYPERFSKIGKIYQLINDKSINNKRKEQNV